MSNNKLTVVICVYNGDKYITETLNSIIEQTYKKFDILIIDDCSSDTSINIVQSVLSNSSINYEIVSLPINGGLAKARSFAENYVGTEYIIFIDSDDIPHVDFVQKLYFKIESDPQLMAVGCYLEFINESSNKISGGQYIGALTKEEFYNKAHSSKLIFMASNAIFRRKLALSVGGRSIEGFPSGATRYQDLCEDLDLWTRMSDLYKDGMAIVVIPEVLFQYRKHSKGMSSDSLNMFLRMKHIKSNLKRRRSNLDDISFEVFFNGLSLDDLNEVKNKSVAADSFRNGVILAKEFKFIISFKMIAKSLMHDPSYIFQKIKSNSGIFK